MSMLHRIRLELTVLAAVAISITALVFAISDDGARSVVADRQAGEDSELVVSSVAIPDGAREVEIVEFKYEPDPVRVAVGATVVWSNSDLAAHTVTADDGSWGSKYMAQGDVFSRTFDEPGVYVYYCELHPPRQAGIAGASGGDKLVAGGGGSGMQGRIIVEQRGLGGK